MSATLTSGGQAAVSELAQRYGVSDGAVRTLLDAVIRGGGAMAQFSHPELGGNGQWMRGGMTMVGDMFNPGLQATVSGICAELSSLLAAGDVLVQPAAREPGAFGAYGGDWWPAEFGRPSTSGGQNDTAYAYFPGPRRLAVRRGGVVALYDTGEHAISGVQQQQGGRGSVEFSSQFGSFTVDSLPIVVGPVVDGPAPQGSAGVPARDPSQSGRGSQTQSQFSVPVASATQPPVASTRPPIASTQPPEASTQPRVASAARPPAPPAPQPPVVPAPDRPEPVRAPASAPATTAAEIGAAIETLAALKDKGFLSDDEFTAKKTELLGRL